eukprot:g28445.t1
MAQAFSAATAEEIRALGEIWQLRSGQKCLEEAVARALKHICRRAERTCVLKSLRQPVARAVDLQEAAQLSDEKLQLEAKIASLQRQLDTSGDRLKKLDALEANAQHLASEPNTLKELLHQLAEEAPAISCDMDADSGLQPALERLGLVSSWLQRTLQQLQERITA